MPYCYILYSSSLDKYYVGACNDINRRLNEHNSGKSKFTSKEIPLDVVHKEFYNSLPEAKKRESYIKKQKSRKLIINLITNT